MAGNVMEFTDANWGSECSGPSSPVWSTSGPPGAAPAGCWPRRSRSWPASSTGKVKIGKMNTDENQETPGGLRISAIPTVLIFHGGKEVNRLVGVNTEAKFKAALSKLGVS